MSITKNIGGDRIGSGAKMNVEMKTYSRSTHDLGYVWRNTQSPGTLVPFMSILGLPGDTFDIDLFADVMTHPTVGPLFGSFKLQMDIFTCPIRLYIAALHNNKLGIGMDMKKIKLPVLNVIGNAAIRNSISDEILNENVQHVSSSSLLAYLGLRGFGQSKDVEEPYEFTTQYNALPILGYWDIFKNYYANKQETNAYVIEGQGNWQPNKNAEITPFPLSNIDLMRENILKAPSSVPYIINHANSGLPYQNLVKRISIDIPGQGTTDGNACVFAQSGLAIKTYQSDLFNNWINTEWIDGENGINTITAIDVSSGLLNLDTLNLSKKVYDMLNRIAISGGSYEDWLETVYTHDYVARAESPVYQGGMSQEVVFQEVVSNSATADEPLGTLAGKGRLAEGSKKGGKITIRLDEPSYIIGIVSLTPRVDYSQGNNWDIYSLKTMDDLHKPALDGIGFQELITEQMAWWDTTIDDKNNFTRKSAGKQPAWINYMTNYSKTYGNFAIPDNEMFMTLNRNYEWVEGETRIEDLTTYIDPRKYNGIFADESLDSMNFWVQISNNITARRKISAKIIPNL